MAVDDHTAAGQLGHQDRHGGGLGVPVDQVLVDLVGQHPQPAAGRPAADRRHLLRRVDGPGRVGGGDEHQQLGPLGGGRLQLLDPDPEPVRQVGLHDHRVGAAEGDRLGVGDPVGGRQQDLVAGVEQGGERLEQGVLAAVGDQDLARLDPQARVAGGLGRDRGPQLGQARARSVVVEPGLVAGGHGRLDDVVGGGEVGLAGAEADHVLAGRLERLGLGVDDQGGRLGDGGDAAGDPWHLDASVGLRLDGRG
jgi:hypothetical protein